jgi:spore coat protein U-like protein
MKKSSLYLFFIIITFIFLCHTDMLFAACTVSTTDVNFGSYDVFSGSPLDATGTITATCDITPPPTVVIAIGTSPNSGGFNPRMMKLTTGSDLLNYNLFTETARTNIWGDGSGSTSTLSDKVRKGSPWIATVYGRIPPSQDVSAGLYNEILTVTITW